MRQYNIKDILILHNLINSMIFFMATLKSFEIRYCYEAITNYVSMETK